MSCLGSPQRPACWILILSSLLLISVAATAQMSLSVSNVAFGSVQVGSSVIMPVAVTNTGKQTVTLSQAAVSGTGFSFAGPNLPITVAPQQSASLSVSFAPQTAGSVTGSLNVSYWASWGGNNSIHSSSVTVALSGTGYSITAATSPGTLGVTPGSTSFGSVTIGTTQTQSGSVTASGGSVTLSSASSSNSVFTLGGLTLPVILAAGQSVPFTVTFAPTTSGTASANISFFTSTSTSALETASGSGATIQHTVDLSWNASTSTSIRGYNVYRGTVSGGPYSKINSALDTAMNYSDSTVQSGQTYYYVTTAVDSAGVESSYSSEVQAVIPFP